MLVVNSICGYKTSHIPQKLKNNKNNKTIKIILMQLTFNAHLLYARDRTRCFTSSKLMNKPVINLFFILQRQTPRLEKAMSFA